MQKQGRLFGFTLLLTLAITIFIVACAEQPTPEATEPAATTGPAATEPAPAAETPEATTAPAPAATEPAPAETPEATTAPTPAATEPAPAETPAATTAPTPAAPGPEPSGPPASAEDVVSIRLGEQNESGQSGIATLTARGSDTEVVLSLSEGTMESSAVHIHSGQCGVGDLGDVVHPLTNITDGSSTTLLEGVSLESLLTGGFAINAHNATDASVYTACGNLPMESDTLTIALNEQNDSGQSGYATLTTRGDDTEVVLTLSEGAMESSAVHIHSGQCGAGDLGDVVHPLTNFTDGMSVTLLPGVSLDSLLADMFAINAHNADDASIYTACGNLVRAGADAGASADISIVATNFEFSVGEIVVPAGQSISIGLSNQGESQHNIFFHGFDALNAEDEEGDRLDSGQSRTREFTFDQPGLYTFYCPVGRHEDAGMIGVLRVEGPSTGEPAVSIEAPTQTRELEGPEITVGVNVANFTLDEDAIGSSTNTPGTGHLELSLDGESIASTASTVASLDNVSDGEHTLTATLLNNDGTPLSPAVEQTITFMVEAGSGGEGDAALGASPVAGKPTVSAINTLSIALNQQNDSGQSGIATLTEQGDDTQVVLSLSEGTMESSAVHIHAGSCPNVGDVAHPLTNITDGNSTTLLEGVSLDSLLTGGFAINAHNATDASVYTACGNLPMESDTLTIALNEQNDSGQSGYATLTTRGDDTEVVLTLSEGAMESSAVHIHAGDCPDVGDVAHPLTNFTDGTSVKLLPGVSLDSLMTGGFAINSHNAADASIYTACGDIPASESADAGPAPVASDIADFVLEDLTIPVGTTVTWTNQDDVSHTTTSGTPGIVSGVWDSGTLANGGSFAFSFDQAGEFPYFCRIHTNMTATVTVTGQ